MTGEVFFVSNGIRTGDLQLSVCLSFALAATSPRAFDRVLRGTNYSDHFAGMVFNQKI